ncbi:MAG: L-arabinose isomerase family protein [Acutalibacteraceae bacterium]|jgi:L-arabinose isomerase
MAKIRAGLLPLYIKLYDDLIPSLRDRLEPFYQKIADRLEREGLEVLRTEFCRVESEFADVVQQFEQQGADCIITLHMAYSPSLESVGVLTETSLPIIVLDTTETFSFDFQQNPDEINYNHGIHGVMDLCSLLRRNGKPYAICAGHWQNSDVIGRAAGFARAAKAAGALKGMRVGSCGGSFAGMGDFLVSGEELCQRFGAELETADPAELCAIRDSVTEEEIEREMAHSRERFEIPEPLDETCFRLNTKACLTVRKWAERHLLGAFSVNFLKVSPSAGLDSMPFTEACRAMEQGIGYAGEGDVLTAAFTGALLQAFPESSFTEIFCPDWQNGNLFLSHMGEMNYRVAEEKPQLRGASFNYTDASAPVVGYARFRGGKAVFLNISRGAKDFRAVVAPVEMLETPPQVFTSSMRGWMRPSVGLPRFLEQLSQNGATHHSILIYGAEPEQMEFFAQLLGMEMVRI